MRVIVLCFVLFICLNGAGGQRLRGRIRSSTFRRDLSTVEPGAATLAFVFDVTGSMWDDLKQVIAGARKILDTTLHRQEKPLHDYVLVPFHDPVVGPITVTTNGNLFQRKLKELFVQGGGDCPEMSLTAIKEALEISLPSSFIYVFTDATAKDHDRLREVLRVIQRKQSQVVFVLTGDCDNRDHPGYKAYEKIAATSSGQVFLITKSDVSEVVKFIEVSVQAHKVVLLATDRENAGDRTWEIPFDPELKEVTISLSGPDRRLRIYDPRGRLMTESDGVEVLLNLESVLIVNIKNATAGRWRVSAYSSGEHSLRVTGLSTLDFQARFSRFQTLDWSLADYQPVEGADTYVLLNATGLPPPGELREISLRDISGEEIQRIALGPPPDLDNPYLYQVTPFLTPSIDFYIYVHGVTHENYPFQRATKNAILNVVPVAPSVYMKSSHPGYFDYPAEIPCQVTSLIPFHVSWSRRVSNRWIPVGEKTLHPQTSTVYLRIEDITEESEGLYRCVANNSKGLDYGQTFLDVEERPPIIRVDGNVTVEPGRHAILTCYITSKIDYRVSWSRVDGRAFDTSRTRMLSNYSLAVARSTPDDEGGYRCTAVNSGGSSSEEIYLTVQAAPEVTVRPRNPVEYVANVTVSLRCLASGYPDPTIIWLNGSTGITQDSHVRLRRGGTELRFVRAQRAHEGVYTCQATNKAGTAIDTGRLIYTESPYAYLEEDERLVLEGETTEFKCIVTGVPKPQIRWFLDGNQIANSPVHVISDDGILTVGPLRTNDAGIYTCEAFNSVGQNSDTIRLTIGTIPVIVLPPVDTGIDIDNSGKLPCVAVGYPAPELTWSKQVEIDGDGSDGSIVGSFELVIDRDEGRIYHDSENNNLVIKNMEMDDVATYVCTATNEFGSDMELAMVSITGLVRPYIRVVDARPHVIAGQSIELPCTIVRGNPTPNRQWTHGRLPFQPRGRISINSEGSIHVTSARTRDAGVYTCTATNVVGDYSASIDLNVWVPPTITTPEMDYTTIEGNSISLSCDVTGNPDSRVEWTKVGVRGPLRYLSDYRVASDHSLIIANPDKTHSGEYKCTATNEAGSVSVDANLVVYYKPRKKDGSLDIYTVVEGNSITLECPVTASNPRPVFSWYFNDEEIVHSTGQYEMNDGRLNIFEAVVSDDGEYTCTATNEAGSVSHKMALVVHVPPRILPGLSIIRGLEGEDINLHCEATGIPLPTVVWMRDEVGVISKGRTTIVHAQDESSSETEMIIRPARLTDDGTFFCIATNVAGKDQSQTILDVQKRPVIVNGDIGHHLTPSKGSHVTIPCVAYGDPNPSIRWFHDGLELTGDELDVDIARNGTLILYSVDGEDSGLYKCEATNPLGKVDIDTRVTVYESPEITDSNGITRFWVFVGEPATMYCYATAVPKPTISWYKAEQAADTLINPEPGHIDILSDGDILNITQSRVSDTGRYICSATNVEGTSSKMYHLDVYVLPSINGNDEINVSRIILGDDFTLECPATGVPFPRIRWFKGHQEILPEDEGMLVDDRGRLLTVLSSELKHDGEYTCVADNAVGEASKDFDVSILVPPSIDGDDMTHTIQVSRYLVIECRASGIPTPSVSWYKGGRTTPIDSSRSLDGGPHTSDNGRYLEFERIRIDDEDIYTCVAINEAGKDTKTHAVDILVPPKLTDEDPASNISVIVGDDVTLTCHASGDPPPTIQWLKNNVLVHNSSRISISENGNFLTIRSAIDSDRGQYACRAVNNVGVVTQNQYLDVLIPPAIGGPDDEKVVIQKGDRVALDCVVSGNPRPVISWEKNGLPMTADDKYSFDFDNQRLIITNAHEDDTASYVCTANNIVGSDSKTFRLEVHVPPSVAPFKQDVYKVVEGERLQLACTATGIPTPEITWLRNEQEIERSSFFKFRENGRVLVIINANVEIHEGKYTCAATNEAGEDTRDVGIVVLIPPVIYGQERITNRVINEGNEVELECRVKEGKPWPLVKWYFGGDEISGLSTVWSYDIVRETLTNVRAGVHHTGGYWCEATNVAGHARKNFTINVQVKPLIEGDERESKNVILNNDISFTCKFYGIPQPTITWLKDSKPLTNLLGEKHREHREGTGTYHLTVLNAQEDDQGTYSCIVTNNAGQDEKLFDLDVYLPPTHGGDGVLDITVLENEDVDLLCDVEAFPKPIIRWYKDGRFLSTASELEDSDLDYRLLPLKRVQVSDAGRYKCEAENIAGIINKTFALNVLSKPKVVGPAVDKIIKLVGDRIDMVCDIEGVPPPTLSWTKNGHPLVIDESKMSFHQNKRILQIFEAELSDTGQFECHGTNVAGRAVKSFDVIIHDLPRISGDRHEIHDVNKGDKFVLECVVTGTPPPSIAWYKNSARLRSSSRVKITQRGRYLEITGAVESDADRYFCNASNVQGYDTKALTVNVRVPPTIEEGPSTQWVTEGQNINLTCNVRSNSVVQIEWLFEGEPIISSNVLRTPQGKRLMIFNAQRTRAGEYTCIATNAAGSVEKDTRLVVYTVPTIQDGDITDVFNVTQGDALTLECDVSGFPEPTIEWLRDYYPIYFDDEGMSQIGNYEIRNGGRLLTLFDADLRDEGTYKCRATNEAGFASKDYSVNVFVPPEIYRDGLYDIVAREKTYVRIECAASGIPPPAIRWLKDGENLEASETVEIGSREEHRSFIVFQAINATDVGTYSCVAENPAGRDMVDIDITVNIPPKIRGSESLFPSTVEVVVGDTLDLECEVIRGVPKPEIEWYKRNQKLIPSNRVKIISNGRYLRIPHARLQDYGIYTCIAKNSEGADRKEFNVLTLEQPEFLGDDNEEFDVILGFSHYILCDIDAQPQPRLEWYKDGNPIEVDRNVEVNHNGRVLLIKSARLQDGGTYTCRAINKAGYDDKTTKINILTPPSISEDNNDNDVAVTLDSPTYLNCTVEGYPQPTITWFRNGIRIDLGDENFETHDNGQILSIASARLLDSGHYDCHARNAAGRDRKDFRLDVHVAPTISGPEYEDFVMLEGRYYELDCFSSGIPDPTIEWYKDGVRLEPDRRYSLFRRGRTLGIFKASDRDNGLMTCTASNVAGEARKTYNITVHMTPKLLDQSRYRNVVANQGDNFTLDCTSNSFPKPTVVWLKNGNEVQVSEFDELQEERIQISSDGFSITIFEAEPSDAAQYSCELSNDAGVASRKFNVVINRPPVISGPERENIDKPISSTISLDCNVQGYPTPEVIWLKDGFPIQFSERIFTLPGQNTLRIDRSVEADLGEYTCIARNAAGEDKKYFDVNMQVPPTLDKTVGPDNIDAILGEEVTMACILTASNPPSQVVWYKGGNPLDVDDVQLLESGQLLILPKVKVSDAGDYTCVASNGIGQDDRSFSLNVLIPPSLGFGDWPKHIEVNETFDAVLHCGVLGGQPDPQITWTHDGQPLKNLSRYKTFSDGKRLEIYRTLTSDTGDYRCTASNVAGTVTDSMRLDVYVPPAFVHPNDQDITLLEGQPLYLDCSVYGVPQPEVAYTLSTDGETSQPLDDERVLISDEIVTIEQTTVDDTGLYSCIASSISGQAQKVFNVMVQVPPSITEPAGDQSLTIIEGNSIDMECSVDGVPVPEVTWLKNGRPLPLLDVSRIRNDGQLLHIESAQLNDIGTYTCVAKSAAGEDSRDFDVDVIVPPSSGNYGSNITAVAGSNVTLECKSKAIPPPTFAWYKDGRSLNYNGHLLVLKNVQVEDSDLYTCEAVNDAGKSVQNILLTVYEKPTIEAGPDNIVALVDDTVAFICAVEGVPTPEVSWWKGSEELSSDDNVRYRYGDDLLEVIGVQLEDSGEYMCLATNDAGSERHKFNLEVQEIPRIARGLTNITTLAGTPVILECEASGTPQPIVWWAKDGRRYYTELELGYRQEESGSIHISAASVGDTGVYRCNAENEAGVARRGITLFVQVPPSIINSVTRYIVEPYSRVKIPCDASGVPSPEVTWTRDGILADQFIGVYVNSDNSLEIPSVGTLHEASYTCTAENQAGVAQYTAEVKVRSIPIVSNPDQIVKALEGTTTTLPCDVSGTPTPTVKWRRGPMLVEIGGRFSMDGNNGLRIFSLEVQDSASYTCVAHNAAGTAFGHVRLDVQVLPTIETDFESNEIAIAGQPFAFELSASGLPEPWIFWNKDGSDISEDDSHYIKQEEGSLVIPIVQPSDQGIYNVTAINEAGSTSATVRLDVIIPPDIRTLSPEVIVIQGSQIPLDFVILEGKPRPEVTWTKDGEPVDLNDDRISQLSYGLLVINNAQPSDAGTYVVTAINDAGRDSAEIKIIVHVPPTFIDTPQDQKRQSGDDMSLLCTAVGYPVPTITWKFNDKLIPASKAISENPGSSRLFIENVRSQDAGSYLCQGTNAAGVIAHMATVTVDSPPVFTGEHDPEIIARLGETARIDCMAVSNPPPTITWTKDGEEIVPDDHYKVLANGSLIISYAKKDDAGTYKCVASNGAGSIERQVNLILELAPNFVIRPSDTTADQGTNVILDCEASGIPDPTITWRKQSSRLPRNDRFTILRNNSLQIASVQLDDTGEFSCIATNDIGSRMAKAILTVQVHGQFGDWKEYGPCSVSCGIGIQTRIRFCNAPSPANGGRDCEGSMEETKPCEQQPCPQNGEWGRYSAWEACSVTCGQGIETRTRECLNQQFGGLPCTGEPVEKRLCSRDQCPVNGNWGSWGSWQPCNQECGEGVSIRTRSCDSPTPSTGGLPCRGSDTSSKICNLKKCPVNGNWAVWGPYTICSVSCGGGTRERTRTCTDPRPKYGGETCPGSNVQIDNCNLEPCPVNGDWSDWEPWSTCSQSCGGGHRLRYRSCASPKPRYGGRFCPGRDTERQSCEMGACPQDGGWTNWNEWTPCDVTCGVGTRARRRSCSNPPPRHNGKNCEGDSSQTDQCTLQPCAGGPRTATGILFGNVNDVPIPGSAILSQGIPTPDGKIRISSVISDIPRAIGNDLKNQVSILTPIYWTFAKEIDGAYNGYTLTGGVFQRQVNVEFPSGQVVQMEHDAKGVDSDGNFNVDIQMYGNVPMFPADIDLRIMDYIEDYIQTDLNSLYAYSDRFYTINDEIMLYTWNHSIQYDESRVMPYLVEQLFGTNIVAEYNPETLELSFEIDVSIAKGEPSNECPSGFMLSSSGDSCTDIDECATESLCSHLCQNLIGSYICECPDGFHIGMDGNTCEDIDECEEDISECEAPFVCENTRGSYRCILSCGPGLETTDDGQACQDINECVVSGERICEHICNNAYGSFICSCRVGYQRVGETNCIDIDECTRGACEGDVSQCHNTPGSYFCTNDCPSGFYMDSETEECIDIDECADPELNHCEHQCENVDGSYRCNCNTGYIMDENTGRCTDLDECKDGRGPCQYGCVNSVGTYRCFCPTGYRITTNGHSCEDIDECLEGEAKCIGRDLMCANSLGDYRCLSVRCPANYKLRNGVCTRECSRGECENSKSVIRFNSTFLRVGVPKNQDLLELGVSYVEPNGLQILHRNTRFRLLTPPYERAWRLFGLRVVDDERGVIYTKTAITRQYIDWYTLRVSARSNGADGKTQYETLFTLFINVAANPFN